MNKEITMENIILQQKEKEKNKKQFGRECLENKEIRITMLPEEFDKGKDKHRTKK